MTSADETRRVLERYAAAWLKGDIATVNALYGDDIVFNYLGRHGLSGRHEGKARAMQALIEFNRRTGRRLKSVTDVIAGPVLGAIVVRETMGPETVEVTRVLVYTVSGGQMRSCTIYDEDPALIDRLVGPRPL